MPRKKQPGETYIPSFKFNLKTFLISIPLIYIGFSLLGMLYGAITVINPIMIINMLVFFGCIIAVYFLVSAVIHWMKSRNPIVNLTVIITSVFATFYSSWAVHSDHVDFYSGIIMQIQLSEILDHAQHNHVSFTRLGHSSSISIPVVLVFYIEGALLLLVPLYRIIRDTPYYCENCQKEYTPIENFYARKSGMFNNLDKGDISELRRAKIVSPMVFSAYTDKKSLYRVVNHTCLGCNSTIVDIHDGSATKDKNEYRFQNEDLVIKGLYVRTSKFS